MTHTQSQSYTNQAPVAIGNAIFLRNLSSTDIRILIALADLNRCGVREIRGQFLCRLLNLSEKTVYRSLSALEKKGYIRRVKRPYKPSLITVRWEKLGAAPRIVEAPGEQVQPNQSNSVHVRTKVPSIYVHTNKLCDIRKRIERAVRSVVVPPTSYLYRRAPVIHRVAHALKLNYVKVIIAILMADYYKTTNPNYEILYPAAWIARMGTLPDEELRIPHGFPQFVEEKLPLLTEKREQIDLNFPPDDNPSWRCCPQCGEWVLDRPLWSLDKHMRYACRARPPDEVPRVCPICGAGLPKERDAVWFHIERCRLRQRLEEIALGHPARECQPETWFCPKCHRRLPPSREELEWHLSIHDLVEQTGGKQ